jgi:FMN reductase
MLWNSRKGLSMIDNRVRVVALGGTPFPESSTEKALGVAARAAAAAGADIVTFGGPYLARLPNYLTIPPSECDEAAKLLEAIRGCDGVLIASPGWHGSVAGFVKNALDYLEETAKDHRPYLDGVSVGLIATAYGWQAATSTLATMRSITHALRGWTTPLGAGVNCAGGIFEGDTCLDPKATNQLETVGRQVVDFAILRRATNARTTRRVEMKTA